MVDMIRQRTRSPYKLLLAQGSVAIGLPVLSIVPSFYRIVFVPEERLVPSEESTEEEQDDDEYPEVESPSESLKLSDIHEDHESLSL
jgi:hypothetical protein